MDTRSKLPELVKFARESQRISQSALAKKAGISQASFSQYENRQATLSQKTLLKIAKQLNINPSYITDPSAPPFLTSKLLKMYFPEHVMTGMDYSTLENLIDFSTCLEIKFLIGTSLSKTFDRMIAKTIIGQFTQAVLVRDQDNNLYLFRRKRKGAYLVGELDFQSRIRELALIRGISVTIDTIRIPRHLSQKINDLSVEREDVEGLFDNIKDDKIKSNRIVWEVAKEVKENHNPSVILTVLQKMKTLDMDDHELLNLITGNSQKTND